MIDPGSGELTLGLYVGLFISLAILQSAAVQVPNETNMEIFQHLTTGRNGGRKTEIRKETIMGIENLYSNF